MSAIARIAASRCSIRGQVSQGVHDRRAVHQAGERDARRDAGGGGNPLGVSGAPLGDVHHARARRQFLYVADAVPGRIYKLTLDGKVVGVLGEAGKELKQFGWIHEIACPSENELYVAELLNWRVQRLKLHP